MLGEVVALAGVSVTMLIALIGAVYRFGIESAKLGELRKDMGDLTGRVEDAMKDVPTMQSSITHLSSDIRELKDQLAEFQAGLSETNEKVAEIRARQQSLAEAFSSHKELQRQQWRNPQGGSR